MKASPSFSGDTIIALNALNFIKNGYALSVTEADGILKVAGFSDRDWTYFAVSEGQERRAAEMSDDDDMNFAAVSDAFCDLIAYKWRIRTAKLIYTGKLPSRSPDCRALRESDAERLIELSHYSAFLTSEYVRDRIKNGISACVRRNGVPQAWAMTHDDGAVGFLHTDKSVRRKGYGEQAALAVIREVMLREEMPFVHIEADNKPSLCLATKLGFVFHSYVNWIGV